jgi:glucose uptake protein
MILPTTYGVTLLLTLLSMICWGSWANTQKLTGRWRFELFYYDYALGVLLATIIAAFTFGTMGSEMSFADNFAIAGKTKFLYGFGAGVVFNLANMLLVAAIAVAGLSVAFPIGIGIALVVGSISNYIINPQGNPALLFGGVGLVLVAIVLDALAYREHAKTRKAAAEAAMPAPEPRHGRRPVYSKRAAPTSTKGIVLSIISGVLMGSFYPLVELGKQGENGLGPYSIGLIFAIGVFFSTFIFNIYFLNLPVIGDPIGMFQYFTGTAKQHILGVVGGLIWCAGMLTNYVAASAPKEVQVGPAVSYAIGQGATMVSALWGVFVWKEFAGASAHAKRLLALMFVFFLIGLTMVSIAPLYAH